MLLAGVDAEEAGVAPLELEVTLALPVVAEPLEAGFALLAEDLLADEATGVEDARVDEELTLTSEGLLLATLVLTGEVTSVLFGVAPLLLEVTTGSPVVALLEGVFLATLSDLGDP